MGCVGTLPGDVLAEDTETCTDWISLERFILGGPEVNRLFMTGEHPNAPADLEAIYLVRHVLEIYSDKGYDFERRFLMWFSLHSNNSLSLSTATRAVLRAMVGVAANIQRLACICLITLHARLQAALPQYLHSIRGIPCVMPCQLRDVGPFSWIEEYRVYRALWHLQVFSDLLETGTRLHWSADDMVWSGQEDNRAA
ncbi:uncharacterized protein BP01DRAFT_385346 [Aspergillus saccharolyticus JOP 1030-1]|uniref:Uncharacterized protein n=1 Tax=Aspergillus saccharolyticus JOP 1030-1 TaxID=1450539 RepID=A0A318ZQT1_9EURO|nr:hypothetical protein BP01DRAFT_385346 [Aspergillus saccharolyticus JOP 1030-1]PYH42458.1 hypothetical protein BP01DRAFT_385346 [Aspergillus saccharolyticus JOP 1030-1]